MRKNLLSRVPWPGNSWIPRNFQADLWAVYQSPKHSHKHSYSLQLAIHTQLAHHYIPYAL